jgi:protein gp37
VAASLNETFDQPVSPSGIVERISGSLLTKLVALYPLRGKISGLEGADIVFNIGQKHGVESGQLFRVVDTDWRLEVKGVFADRCTAVIKEGAGQLKVGLSVEAVEKGAGAKRT